MSMMIDATCAKCGKRIGWAGRFADRPSCPRCGHRPPQADLDATDARMDADRKLLASRPEAGICREQRLLAGLTLRQAAKLLGLAAAALSDYEAGRAALPADVAEKMAAAYGLVELAPGGEPR